MVVGATFDVAADNVVAPAYAAAADDDVAPSYADVVAPAYTVVVDVAGALRRLHPLAVEEGVVEASPT